MNIKHKFYCGFTIIEMVMAVMLTSVMMAGIGLVIVDQQKAWGSLRDRVFNRMAEDGYVAGVTFETICRKSSQKSLTLGTGGVSCKFSYYNDLAAENPDRTANFYIQSGKFYVEHRTTSGILISKLAIADKAQSVQFAQSGNAVNMKLILNDGTRTMQFFNFAVRNAP